MSKFVHLAVASEFSVNYSICRIKEIVAAAKKYAMPALAITDANNLYGAFKFFNVAVKAGIKPIIGAKVLFTAQEVEFPVYLYCKNTIGYRILNRIIYDARDKPIATEALASYRIEGLICIVPPCLKLLESTPELSTLFANFTDNVYLGLQRLGTDNCQKLENFTWDLAKQQTLPVVAITPVCFMEATDFEPHEIRVCINRSELFKPNKSSFSKEQWFKTSEAMCELFSDQAEAIQNTIEIAKRCNFAFEQGINHLPLFPISEECSLDEFFAKESKLGLEKRFSEYLADDIDKSEYYQRLQVEIKIIQEMNFSGYFLIVADFINWSRANDIPVGPGRGSGAGSLVAYALGITDIDPIFYGLLFERFLNPERVSMPDFDIDFCMDGRDQVISYVANKYGDDHVSQIITFGTLAAKAVVRDVGRVLGHPYGFMDSIAKLIPNDLGMTLEKALLDEPALDEKYRNEPEVERIFNLAMKLEGLVRQVGRHAGGVVIAPRPLLDFMPVDFDQDNGSVSQFDKDDLESIGLVKFDFLGLRTLTIIDLTIKSIKAAEAKNIELHKIPLDDEKVFKLLQAGESTAVFQLESRGMKELIKRLKPDCFEDIVSLVALFRPGPLQSGMVDDFIDRKHGKAEITYLHPCLEPILSATYGVILYQEQVMQIAQILSGYTLGGADLLRRAMGKKKPEEMAKQRDVFISGALNNGVAAELSGKIFDVIEKFAGYGFNRSHSVAYALLSYQTAWFKANYPSHFMASVLTSDLDNTDKVIGLLDDCKQIGLKVTAPNINDGIYEFRVNKKNEIVYGLGAIKGVGSAAINALTDYRAQIGGLENLIDVITCLVKQGKMNKKLIESLCYAGALDVWGKSRESIIASIDLATKFVNQVEKKSSSGQGDLFGATDNSEFEYIEANKWGMRQFIEYEYSVLGYYASGHPIQVIEPELKQLGLKPLSTVKIGKNKKLVGMVSGIRTMQSKSGRPMLFFILSDGSCSLDIAVFGKQTQDVKEIIAGVDFAVVEGDISIDDRNGGLRVQANSVVPYQEYCFSRAKVLNLKIDASVAPNDFIEILQDVLKGFPRGDVRIIINHANESILAGSDYHISLQLYFYNLLLELDWLEISLLYEIPESCRSYD